MTDARDHGATADADDDVAATPVVVVGIGFSEGGAAALQELFGALAGVDDVCFVVIAQQDASAPSVLPELIARVTTLAVEPLVDGTRLRAGRVYLAPATGALELDGATVRVVLTGDPRQRIDDGLTSLATAFRARAVGILLSGTGSDGTVGLESIHRHEGMTMAQDDASARSEAMPRNAVTTGVVDHVRTPTELAGELAVYVAHVREILQHGAEVQLSRVDELLPEMLVVLQETSFHGLHHYKPTTLARRITRRMQILRDADPEAYLARLRDDPEEAQQLLREVLIGVTSFFRDPEAFVTLADAAIRRIVEDRRGEAPIRVWVPGCATGEEAYTLAILFCEALARLEQRPTVQIFATDIDERALAIARRGAYPIRVAETISRERLDRFFVRRNQQYQVTQEIREMCLFSRHNLVSDPPFSRLDLISCRNVLIYLGPPLQQKLLSIFHYSLRAHGFLFLGPSENIAAHTELFRAVSARQRISQRRSTPVPHPSSARGEALGRGESGPTGSLDRPDLHLVGQRILLDEFAPSYVIVDDQGQILVSSAGVERYLEFTDGPFKNNVVRLARSGLRTALRPALAEAIETRRKVVRHDVVLDGAGTRERLGLTVQPMPRLGEAEDMLMVVFHELPAGDRDGARPQGSVESGSAGIIAQLEGELASTRDELERSILELESANEELKSSNEELLSMNEELQAANEELESSKEEIQSTNEALARSNADLENLLDSSEIATIFLDPKLRVQRFSRPATAIYNLLPQDIGRPLAHITHNLEAMGPLPELQVSESEHVEMRTSDGRVLVRRVLPYRTPEGSQEGIVLTFTDVTDLRGHARIIREQMAELESIYASVPIGLAVFDRELRYRRVNRFLAMLDGGSIDTHLGATPSEVLGPIGEQIERALHRVFEGRQALEGVELHGMLREGPGGEHVWLASFMPVVDGGGDVVAVNAVVQDVTQRSRDDRELRERERMSRTLADAAPVMIWMADTEQRCVFVNRRWSEFTGREHEHELGSGWLGCLHPDDTEPMLAACTIAYARREAFELEIRLRRHDGEYRWVLNRGVPRYDYDGVFEGFIGGCIDVTDRLRYEQQLARAKHEADAANRAKSHFLANMSHEIRTPMSVVLGYADLLLDRVAQPEDRACVETIRRNGQFLLRIVNDILDLSKIEAGTLVLEQVRFSPGALVVELRELLDERVRERGLPLHLRRLGSLPETVVGDPTRLRQVLVNLVGNAIKFTDEGELCVTVELLAEQGELRFTIADTGIGMDAELQRRLFEPFNQADTSNTRRHGGTGLGLAISKRLVDAMGGRIWAESELGAGSTFRFTVPTGDLAAVAMIDALPEPAVVSSRDPIVRTLADRTVLLVDDVSDVRNLLRSYLEDAGAQVVDASDGAAALVTFEAMRREHRPPDVVLLDMQMPVLDGYGAARGLRAAGYTRPIIALTAAAMKGDRERCLEAGCDDYLTKPVTLDALIGCVARHCADPEAGAVCAEHGANRHVLLVEDNEDAGALLAALLERAGYEVRHASSGREAIALATALAPAAVLLDIGLPDMDGFEVLSQLRVLPGLSGTRFIALSGYSEDAHRWREAGFHHHVEKPGSIARLRELLPPLTPPPD